MKRAVKGTLGTALALLALGLAGMGCRLPAAAQEPDRLDVAPPELVGDRWLNTPDGKPLSLGARKGKLTVVHFWTFG
jgi:hypothetical protein